MIKNLRIICIITLILFIITAIIGNKFVKHIKYEEFSSTFYYFTLPTKYINKHLKKINHIFIDDSKINNINNLIDESDYVLRIRMNDNPKIVGNGIINNVKVSEVIKGEKIKLGDTIKIYDLINNLIGDYVEYFGGITPLNKENNYIVFLKKAPSPNIKDSYIFASIKYGHFNISNLESNVLTNYEQGSLYVKDILKYDYIETNCETSGYHECDSFAENYSKLKEELITYLNISNNKKND